MRLAIEIRPGEGGDDSKMLIKIMSKAYLKTAQKKGWTVSYDEQSGL